MEILGVSLHQTPGGAYALVLGEVGGESRRMPVIIGGYEAQAIALEIEKMSTPRPLTHDLFKTFAVKFGIVVKEAVIYNLSDGIFYAKLVCFDGEKEHDIDARTSDAIAIALRFKAPIYTFEFILASAGMSFDKEGNPLSSIKGKAEKEPPAQEGDVDLPKRTLEELMELLQKELDQENYEKASLIRDELNRRKHS